MIQMVSNIKVISVEKLKGLLLKIPTPTPTLPSPPKKKRLCSHCRVDAGRLPELW